MPARAKCLCGAVRMTIETVGETVGACHCEMCRRWGGGPFLAVSCGTDVKIEGQEHVGVYDSSEWAERGFCTRCGSHLFYRLKQARQHMVPPGLIDGLDELAFDTQWFIDRKPAYYTFADETKDLTAAEVFAMFGPNPDDQ